MAEREGRPSAHRLHEAAWPDMFTNLQSAYAELAQAQFELQTRTSEIQTARDLFEQVVASISEGLFLLDHTGQIVRVNPAATTLLGRAEADLVGKPFRTICGESNGVPTNPWQLLKQAPEGTLRDVEFDIATPAGVSRTLSTSWALVRDKRGKIVGVLGIARDVTVSKQAEQERARLLAREQSARQEAEAANRAKDEFLAMLSHELRTPLNAMMGWVNLLRAGFLDPPTTAKALETIERNLKIQTQLIEDILDVSRIITGKLALTVKSVELAAVTAQALESLRPAAAAKGLTMQTVFEPSMEPVAGDSDRLQQIVWNLLSNAIKFTPRGGRVVIRLERRDAEAQLIIRDTGKGIAPDFVPFIFERFRQADSSSTRAHGGLGLGLAIVRHLVDLHGGTVSAESEGEGRGATFTVRLPFATPEATGILERRAEVQTGSAPDALPNLAGVRVLVVDDAADERELFTAALASYGAVVTAAGSVEEALTAFEQSPPDIIVSDIAMPERDGYELIRRVRAMGRERGGGTPAIALTAYARAEDRRRALMAGFQLHVAKPADPAEVVYAVATLTGRPAEG
jgi:PAS domain S-box-containing protein